MLDRTEPQEKSYLFGIDGLMGGWRDNSTFSRSQLPALLRSMTDHRNVVVWIVGTMAVLKLIAVLLYIPAGTSIFDVQFSFGPYLKSLYDGKGFAGCDTYGCDYSSRMPGLPYFLLAISGLTTSMRVAAAIKVVLLSIMVYFACRAPSKRLTTRTPMHLVFYAAVSIFIVFSPNLIKHTSAMNYEEGYNIELLAVTTLCVMTLLLMPKLEAGWVRYVVPIVTASLCYLFKSSMILVWLSVSAIVLYVALTSGRKWLAVALLALAVVSPLSWLAHNYATGHRLSVMSSYDGENMFRGWNAHTLDIYPQCTLDVLFEPIDVCMGKKMDYPKEVGRSDYATEWDWNDGYKKRATDWIVQNPLAAIKTLGVKFYTVAASVRLAPYRLSDRYVERSRGAIEEALGSAWLTIGRLFELFGLVMSVVLLLRGDARARHVAIASLLLTAAYATPYVLGYGFERHFAPFVMLSALCSIFVFSEWQRIRGTRGTAAADA
jgi:hypothetical protein